MTISSNPAVTGDDSEVFILDDSQVTSSNPEDWLSKKEVTTKYKITQDQLQYAVSKSKKVKSKIDPGNRAAKLYYKQDVENLEKSLRKPTEDLDNISTSNNESTTTENEAYLKKQIEILQEQLVAKDETIRSKDEIIVSISNANTSSYNKLLELMSQQQELTRNQQLLQKDIQKTISPILPKLEEVQTHIAPKLEEKPPQKVGFLARLFGSKDK